MQKKSKHVVISFLQAAVLFCGMLLLSACNTARVANPLTGELAGNDDASQMAFWHGLAVREMTSNDEAFHALLLYLEGQDQCKDFDQRVALLKSRGLLPKNFSAQADQAVLRGNLAVAVAGFLEIKGGLTMRLFGSSRRYALRELQYEQVFPPSSPNQTFSGAQFVALMGRIEDYQRIHASVQ